jgi:hypothetical protein
MTSIRLPGSAISSCFLSMKDGVRLYEYGNPAVVEAPRQNTRNVSGDLSASNNVFSIFGSEYRSGSKYRLPTEGFRK